MLSLIFYAYPDEYGRIKKTEQKVNLLFDKRPEHMGVAEFEMITRLIGEQTENSDQSQWAVWRSLVLVTFGHLKNDSIPFEGWNQL